MHTALRLEGRNLATISFVGVRLHRGASVHRAALVVEVHPAADVAGTLVELECEVHLQSEPRLWLGTARASGALSLQTFLRQAELAFSLSDDQINQIEATVSQSGVSLDLAVRARVVGTDGREHIEYGSAAQVAVGREEWLRQLAGLGRASWFVVGVLEPPGGSGLAEVVGHLRESERLFTTREFSSAAVEVRKALEIIGRLCPNMPSEQSIQNAGKSRDRPPPHRLVMLYHAALGLAHLAPHADPVAATFTWRREQAQTLLALVHGIAAQIAADDWPSFPPAGAGD